MISSVTIVRIIKRSGPIGHMRTMSYFNNKNGWSFKRRAGALYVFGEWTHEHKAREIVR